MPSRSRPPRLLLSRAIFVLPNLFTLSGVFCGFYAIVLTSGTPSSHQMMQAALAIFFGIFFDMADGRVARLTRTQSEFGVQLDSLADCCTFGMAPAVLAHRWILSSLGLWGAAVAFVYVACGAIRLARFNVLAAQNAPESKKWFVGLPIPLAAGVLASLVMFCEEHGGPALLVRRAHVVAVVLILAYLMVSNVRYRAFKDVALGPRSLALFAAMVSSFALASWRFGRPFAFFLFFATYVAVGLVEEVLFFGRRRREAGAGARQKPAAVPPSEAPP